MEIHANCSLSGNESICALGEISLGEVEDLMVFIIIVGIIAVITVLANSLICFVFLIHKPLHTVHNGFLLCLSIADLLNGLITIPLVVLRIYKPDSTDIVGSVLIYTLFVTAGSVIAITWDRFLSVKQALLYNARMTHTKVKLILLSVWLVPFALVGFLQTVLVIYGRESLTFKITVGVFDVFFVVSVYLVCLAYVRIFGDAQRQRKAIEKQFLSITCTSEESLSLQQFHRQKTSRQKHRKLLRETRAARQCYILSITFALCWLPTILYDLCTIFGVVNPIADQATIILAFINCVIDPMVYSLCRTDFRSGIVKVFAKWFRRSNGGGEREAITKATCNTPVTDTDM